MQAMISGHEGFIGRHFAKYLRDQGYQIWGADIKSGLDCRDVFKQDTQHYDFIVHCAAIVGGREKIEGDPLSVATDLSIDAEFFNWIIRTDQTCPIIYFSSSAAYRVDYQTRMAAHVPLKETDIDFEALGKPDMTYGWSKITGEYLAQIANKQYGRQVYVFRPFSGYGTDQDDTYPFPSFIKRALNREDPFIIWGTGEQSRDFIHVDDVIGGVMAAVDHKLLVPINLCSGQGVSFKTLAMLVTSQVGYAPKYVCDIQKPEGVFYRVGDPTLFHSIYTPTVSLVDGVIRALEGK